MFQSKNGTTKLFKKNNTVKVIILISLASESLIKNHKTFELNRCELLNFNKLFFLDLVRPVNQNQINIDYQCITN